MSLIKNQTASATMLKLLLFIALVANVVLIVSSTDNGSETKVTSGASSGSNSDSNSDSSSYSKSNSDSSSNSNSSSNSDSSSSSNSNSESNAGSNSDSSSNSNSDSSSQSGSDSTSKSSSDSNSESSSGSSSYSSSSSSSSASSYNDEEKECNDNSESDEDDLVSKKDKCKMECAKNEVYIECPSYTCTAKTCAQLGYPQPCPIQVADSTCPVEPACLCVNGYLRNDKGECVPDTECPSCGGDPNAQAGCGTNCGRHCSNYDKKPVACPQVCIINGCDCKPDYVYDDSIGKCVLPKDCKPECGANEVFSSCINGGCFGARYCTEIGQPTRCVKLDPKFCKKGCVCKDGLLRNENGVCVPQNECPNAPTCNKPNEIFDPCPRLCPPQKCGINPAAVTCARVPEDGDPECIPGCQCCDGYVRNDNGICVSPDQCPTDKCTKPNEEYLDCPVTCPPQTCASIGESYNCPVETLDTTETNCKGACMCIAGYLRNDAGECIPKNDCPNAQCTKPNEEYVKCPVTCPPQTCDSIGQSYSCPAQIINSTDTNCQAACMCISGYLRNDAGECIPEKDCPNAQCTKPNEEYVKCPVTCPPQTCDSIGQSYSCPAQIINSTDTNCQGACMCISGYLRNDAGECIPEKDCPNAQCTKPNEEYVKCPVTCPPQTCDSIGQSYSCPAQIINSTDTNCQAACMCISGYLRNDAGECIPEKDCPNAQCTKPNEEYVKCPVTCPPQTCDSIGQSYSCPAQIINSTDTNCQGACMCISGYLRNDAGECIPEKDCPNAQCTKPNEEYVKCPVTCPPQTCDSIGQSYSCPAQIINSTDTNCQGACMCISGYLRNDAGECIPEKDCPNAQCTKPHEEYVKCPVTCPPQTCDSIGQIYACPAQIVNSTDCQGACMCISGYLRNEAGVCVAKADCPTCGGDPNAKPGCGVNCGRHCNRKLVACSKICKDGCDCKTDYLFDDNTKKCVLPEDCTQVCTDNEVYSDCTNGGCFGARKCSEIGSPVRCVKLDPKYCKKGCLCKDGYLRNDEGECVSQDTCPNNPKCDKPNEIYDSCPATCPPQKCGIDPAVILCAPNPKVGDPECQPGCRCVDDYVRNDDGVCITKDQCPACGDNEIYSNCVNGGCYGPRNCSEKGEPEVCVDLAKGETCKGGCICQQDYLRNDDGVCIPQDQCPSNTCSNPNEVYDECPVTCPPRVCGVDPRLIKCAAGPKLGDPECKPGCRCCDGYLRNKKGVCVPKNECESCKGDPNAKPGCGINCGRLCSNYKHPDDVACIQVCYIDGCDCKEDYVLDTNTGKCVLPEQCTPVCGNNEVYSSCANGGCYGARNCSEINRPTICVDLIKGGCKGACLCKDDYLRNHDGICVPKDQCPNPKCNKPNEEFSTCIYDCPPQTCQSIGQVYHCPLQNSTNCKAGCKCKDGYFRNAIGDCILKENCPDKCPNPNEVYDSCLVMCSPGTCESIGKSYNCPSGINCKGGCKCKSGYYRNKIGECISQENCLKCNGTNEYYSCGGACDNVCATLSKQNQTHCPIINVKCNEMCYCEKGYARDSNNICIPIDKCPCEPTSCKGDPNAKPGCGVNCGKHCSEVNKEPVSCAAICYTDGCDCNEGYLLDDNTGKCVLPSQCTPTCGANEEYSECTQAVCRNQYCSDKGIPKGCGAPDDKTVCLKGCVCKQGYLRDNSGTCVLEDQCDSCGEDKCTGENEEYDDCPPKCPPQTCDSIGKNYFCPAQNASDCQGACRCKADYYRNANNECVTKEECYKCTGQNEYYDLCPGSCSPQTCDSIGKEIHCPITAQVCRPACRCADGFYRNSTGNCVTEDECDDDCGDNESTCNGDPNATPGCGVNCGRLCSNYQNADNVACPEICYKNGCDCKKSYVLDDNTGKCVLPGDCTPVCEINEEFSSCTQAICRNQNCTQKGESVRCLRIDPKYCIKGCVCKDTYLRSSNGTCVPEDQCDTCPEGEIYNTCPAEKCDAEYCPQCRNSPVACRSTKNCHTPRCTCGFNEKRDRESGKCIAIADCPPFDCDGPNEEYQSCPPSCPGQNCSDYINKSKCPKYKIGIVVPCQPQCRCKDNYYRNTKGICIKASECKKAPVNKCDDDDDNGDTETNIAEAQERFNKGLDIFTAKFFKEMLNKTDDSFIFSAASVDIPLAELFLYCNGDSLDQLKILLNLETKEEVRLVFRNLLDSYKSQENIEFDVAAKVYVNEDYPLSDAFLDDTKQVFDATAENVDCSNSQQAADTMNQWVEDNTNNRIKDLVSPDMISTLTRLVLLNAMYFKGDWQYQFNPNDTQNRDFHVNKDTTTQVQTMYQKGKFKYVESEDFNAKFLELPYENENFTCLIVLPNDNLEDLIDAIQDTDKFNAAYDSLSNQTVEIWLPVMEIETTIDLADMLKKLGVTLLFDPANSGLDGILKDNEPLFVSSAIQKAYVKVNEQGSEAAAANAVVVGTRSLAHPPPEEYEFRADHPYIFVIRMKDTIIFSGVFKK